MALRGVRSTWRLALASVMTAAVIGFGWAATGSAGAEGVNCDDNAVIFCGGSTSSLINKYDHGDGHNSAASIQHIFNWFDITSSDVNSMASTGQEGSVTSSGDVFVGSKLVATNALTGGRQDIAGSTRVVNQGTPFFSRPPRVSFLNSSLSAVVVMKNGVFQFAVLHSCGNPVIAHPTKPAPKPTPKPTPKPKPMPKPMPKPAPTPATINRPTTVNICSGNTANSNSGVASQGGNCSINTTTIIQNQAPAQQTPSQPTFSCDALTITLDTSSDIATISNFQVTAANGASFTGADIDWGDGSTLADMPNIVGQTHQFNLNGATSSMFTVNAVAHFSVNSQDETAGGPNCQQQVTLSTSAPPATPSSTTPTTTPSATAPTTAAPETAPTQLVNTGPGNLIAIFGVTSVLGAVGYRLLLTKLVKRL